MCSGSFSEAAACCEDWSSRLGRCAVVTADVAENSETCRTGKPCGHIRGRSVDVAGIDEVGLIHAFDARRCQRQHQSAMIGNNCRTANCRRSVCGTAMRKRLT
jgi:hypothetical protein